MGSLSDLLAKEGFQRDTHNKFSQKKVKFNRTVAGPDRDSIALPIYICHDRKSFDVPRHKKSSSVVSSKGRRSSVSRRSDEPAIDEVATKAVISILSGYAGKYLRDKGFRDSLREKCCSCLVRSGNGTPDDGVFADMELGIESVEKLIDDPGTMKELRVKLLRNSIGFLTIVACGNRNSNLSACAQLYLSIVYKLEKNDRACAKHALQVFVDSPHLARTHLLPDLWEHFFLPHLLHLKIWYNKQVENVSDYSKNKEEQMRHLSKVYEDQMDMGTIQFALYYQEWLKTSAQPPASLPSVPLPPTKVFTSSSTRRRRSSSCSFTSTSSINNFLNRAGFGPPVEKSQSVPAIEFDYGALEQKTEEQGQELCLYDYNTNLQKDHESRLAVVQTSSSLSSSKPDYTCFLPCQTSQTKTQVTKPHVVTTLSDLNRAVSAITTSTSLAGCETAIRTMTNAWLNDPSVEKILSKPSVIEGMLEILFASSNEEILELIISLLTEFVTRNNAHAKIILSLDPQLAGFAALMKNSSLFLKAASLLHAVKPHAKQMIFAEWIPLVLRVLEFGDQTQTLFSVRCRPEAAAYYFLRQLLGGFDEDRNLENARLVVSLGGLSLLLRRMAVGDALEKAEAACIIYSCIRADGRCRHYLADNMNPELVLAILVLPDGNESALSLLFELICLQRFEPRTKIFNKLLNGWGCINTMQILLVSLQKSTRENRPLVAAIILQLDLMGDPLKSSVYREEAIEAIIEALDCRICDEKVQEQAAKALLILGSRYAYTGTPEAEKWILKEAGFEESLEGGFRGRSYFVEGSKHLSEDDDEIEHWQRKAAMALWTSGGKKLIRALSESMAYGIPYLARASLVTVAWMSKTVRAGDVVQTVAWSTLVRQLIESLNRNNVIEERVLASFSLLALSNSSDSMLGISEDEKKAMVVNLRNISKATWTAKKLTSIVGL